MLPSWGAGHEEDEIKIASRAQTAEREDAPWRCSQCGACASAADVRAWDGEVRRQLREISATIANGTEKDLNSSSSRLAGLLQTLLSRCHPNHALVLQARLALVTCATPLYATSMEETRRKIELLNAALHVAGRVLPPYDAQKGDLLFQLGVARNCLASSENDATMLKASIQALLGAVAQFNITFGGESKPAQVSRELANLGMRRLRDMHHRQEGSCKLTTCT